MVRQGHPDLVQEGHTCPWLLSLCGWASMGILQSDLLLFLH